jgi:hypothetical protein
MEVGGVEEIYWKDSVHEATLFFEIFDGTSAIVFWRKD